ERALAGHGGRLDVEDLAAGGGPGQADRDAGRRGAVGRLSEELRRPQRLGDLLGADLGRLALALGVPPRDLAADRRHLALEVPQARLARVVDDDLPDRLVAERRVAGLPALR